MDSRWKFLHYSISELRGRRTTGRPGNEKTGASTATCDAERTKVAKLPIRAAGKSRYCVYCTRTANRHR